MMDHIFEAIAKTNKTLEGRVTGVHYTTVAVTEDPWMLGRIQCIDPSKGGRYLTAWLHRILPFPGFSPPLPRVGDSVLIGYIDGNPHNGVYLGVLQNLVNPTLNQGDDLVISVGETTIRIAPDGTVTIGAKNVVIGTDVLSIEGAHSVSINGQQIATVGGNTASGVIVGRGW